MISVLLYLIISVGPLTEPDVRTILDPFTGTWQGTFRVFTYDGKLLTELETEHRYYWEGDVQVGAFTDRYADGRVEHARARNYMKDGVLVCEVEKDGGERTVHTGTYTDGSLFWHFKAEDGNRIESFRERIVETPDGREYQIDGFGLYTDGGTTSHLVFVGRYRAVAD